MKKGKFFLLLTGIACALAFSSYESKPSFELTIDKDEGFNQVTLYDGETVFSDLENINLEKKNKNIIILPESYYYCILCDYSDIKTNVKVYNNLLKINKARIIIESELYSDYSKIVSPIFELRCSLNENEAAEIIKKSLIRSDFFKNKHFLDYLEDPSTASVFLLRSSFKLNDENSLVFGNFKSHSFNLLSLY